MKKMKKLWLLNHSRRFSGCGGELRHCGGRHRIASCLPNGLVTESPGIVELGRRDRFRRSFAAIFKAWDSESRPDAAGCTIARQGANPLTRARRDRPVGRPSVAPPGVLHRNAR
jgi:hypothetical protein